MLPFVIISLTAACAPPGFVQSNDPECWIVFFLRAPIRSPLFQLSYFSGMVGTRCSDLILYPVSAVDQSDQYRFDYSDVSFGNTHAQGATVAITCTTGGQPATVEGYDQVLCSLFQDFSPVKAPSVHKHF
ncbi:unnamed protein product [Angiostrongylus costaricensis]|uniref:Sushi domain-containing protein n=1 Tax=Angiostrongylus costaricensis TaxID=334426 RepID=A0A0R3PW23_ANGCS|nr:unnamed protein product [Angiostrongylus costaricensis]